MSTLASRARRRATSISCCSATESRSTGVRGSRSPSPTWLRYGVAALAKAPGPARQPCRRSPRKRLSAIDSVGTRESSCCTTAIRACSERVAVPRSMVSPPRRMCPSSGANIPARILTRVLFPAPFSPTSAITSPARTSKRRGVERPNRPERLRDRIHFQVGRFDAHGPTALCVAGAARAPARPRRRTHAPPPPGAWQPAARTGSPRPSTPRRRSPGVR